MCVRFMRSSLCSVFVFSSSSCDVVNSFPSSSLYSCFCLSDCLRLFCISFFCVVMYCSTSSW